MDKEENRIAGTFVCQSRGNRPHACDVARVKHLFPCGI